MLGTLYKKDIDPCNSNRKDDINTAVEGLGAQFDHIVAELYGNNSLVVADSAWQIGD